MLPHSDTLATLYPLIGYRFNNERLIRQALTRTSAINEGLQPRDIGDFQRLECLGDSILNTAIKTILFTLYPRWPEGRMTQETARYVNNHGPLTQIALNLKLDQFLLMGRGEERLRKNGKILSDHLEALYGAIWEDSGHDYALIERLTYRHFGPLGLSQPVIYSELQEILYDYRLSQQARLEKLTAYLDQHVTEDEWLVDFIGSELLGESPAVLALFLGRLKSQPDFSPQLFDCIGYRYENMAIFLSHGADPNAIQPQGPGNKRSILQAVLTNASCSQEERQHMLSVLFAKGANPNRQDGETTITREGFMFAAKEAIRSTLSLALPEFEEIFEHESGVTLSELKQITRAKPTVISHTTHESALHTLAACEFDSLAEAKELVASFIAANANLNLVNSQGQTPLDVAKAQQNRAVYLALQQAGAKAGQERPSATRSSRWTQSATQFGLFRAMAKRETSASSAIQIPDTRDKPFFM